MIATPFHSERVQRDEYAAWLSDLANWTHAVTVSCQPSPMGYARSGSDMKKAATHFVHILNRRLLGRHHVAQGHRIASVAVMGMGAYQDNPHVHLAFESPSNLPHEKMRHAIEDAIKSTKGLGIEETVKPYVDEGWITYMLDHGMEGLLVDITTPAKH